ncbi:tannase [Enterocloster clostridioformis]|uniref:subtype A tannase n=1 Tax=Enterocloster clostridioformis TaxID=1531 RepID=UPI00080C5CF4|nr:subtype A tannase [Enterocloster clostridioformis]ANU45210.1 tannase [Lachnoclostridium sp. YL32]NDO32486.1 tannase [Enterocloster clostridioformis]OXE63506.1 tannase [Enterocloster clostridioformis]QQR00025.1 tannase [Enterocloster clostridioformis]
MKLKKMLCAALSGILLLSGCASKTSGAGSDDSGPAEIEAGSQLTQIDMTKWQYQEDTDVYWQVGIPYCETPADADYENLGIFIPGSYMTGTDNGDGTFTCEVNAAGSAGGFTAETAPIVIPVETPGYSAMAAPTGYVSSTSAYTDAGFVYVYPGCRGREAGAPAGVTDLKAAIRYIRYNEAVIPGSTERIFSYGMSGGGGQSALLGATGDSELYTPYLEAIGAVNGVSDAVAGSMCWCPITSLDYASEAYEWNLGVTRTGLSEDMQALSDAMAEQFALYINELGLTDEHGNPLTLVASEDGIYQAGSYYDYLKTVVETSLNHFLEDTAFPYTVTSGKGGFGGGMMGEFPDGDFTGRDGFGKGGDGGPGGGMGGGRPELEGGLPELGGDLPEMPGGTDYYALDGIDRNEASGGVTISGTYETVQDYIDALNAETQWVSYDSATNTATITSITDFVSALKRASKNLGAFDDLDETQGENILFGDGDGQGDHFDAVMAELLTGTEYETAFTEDLQRMDALGNSIEYRVSMYSPLYYLSRYYEGYGTSTVASYWRIRSGINQSDTALSTEVNLALALENLGMDVDFETVWGQAHVEAERTGDSTTNFIEWVVACCQ